METRLLGNSGAKAPKRYVEFGDPDVKATAERIGKARACLLAGAGI